MRNYIKLKKEMDQKMRSYINFWGAVSEKYAAPEDWMILTAVYQLRNIIGFYNNNVKGSILDILLYKRKMNAFISHYAELEAGKKRIVQQG